MNLRGIVMDAGKAIDRPGIVDLAAAIERVAGVAAVDVAVTEESAAMMPGADQVAAGRRIIGAVQRSR